MMFRCGYMNRCTFSDKVDGQPALPEVLVEFDAWLAAEGLAATSDAGRSFAPVTCGEWDLGWLLRRNCQWAGAEAPGWSGAWVDLKKAAFGALGTFPRSMLHLLQLLQLPHAGRHHSGLDDAANLAAALRQLCLRGHLVQFTSSAQ